MCANGSIAWVMGNKLVAVPGRPQRQISNRIGYGTKEIGISCSYLLKTKSSVGRCCPANIPGSSSAGAVLDKL